MIKNKADNKYIIISILLITALLYEQCNAIDDKDTKQVNIGFFNPMTDDIEAQLKMFWSDFFSELSNSSSIRFNLKYYNNSVIFLDEIEKGNIQIAYTSHPETFYHMIMTYNYRPFISIAIYGKKQHNTCIYVKQNSSFKSITDLKNKSISVNNADIDYYLLYDEISEKPESYFSDIRVCNDGMAVLYPLALGEVESALALDTLVEYFKQVNPGVAKDVRKIWCSQYAYIITGGLHIEKLDEEIILGIKNIMLNLDKNKKLKKWQSLLKATKSEFIIVSLVDYEKLLKLYGKVFKEKWDLDYRNWSAVRK